MNARSAVASLLGSVRAALGPAGAFLPYPGLAAVPVEAQRDAVRRLERVGYGGVWTNEVPGKDALVQLAVLLAASERVVLGTGVANVWTRSPQTAHGGAALLAQAYPGRFVLGLGVGHPAQAAAADREFGRPLATMRAYLARLGAPVPGTAPATPYPLLVGANGPKMLALAGELADGAIPALVTPTVTADARAAVGTDGLLVVLIDAAAEQGDPEAVAAVAAAHRRAGADHVVALLPIGTDYDAGVQRLEQLAPAMLAVS